VEKGSMMDAAQGARDKIVTDKIWLVEWQDAHSNGGWLSNERLTEFIEAEKCICITVGWILKETKDDIIMASRTLKWAEDDDYNWGQVQKIPEAWIRKIVIYRYAKKERQASNKTRSKRIPKKRT